MNTSNFITGLISKSEFDIVCSLMFIMAYWTLLGANTFSIFLVN